jgi:hypothetical protein
MPLRPPLRVSITRHGEKEQNLKDFLLRHIGAAACQGGAGQPFDLQIVARSLESPLIKAITSLGPDIAASGLSVRLILAQLDPALNLEAWERSLSFAHEIRWAKHPRLIEAHEQLVIGPETCWIGDCMRRDPAKCDAYESFVEHSGEAAGCAAVSFERLWLASQPLATGKGKLDDVAPPAALTNRAGSEPTLATRH